MKDFRVPIGIYRLDKRVAVRASVPIAVRGLLEKMCVNQTSGGVTQGDAIHLKVRRKKQKEEMEEK